MHVTRCHFGSSSKLESREIFLLAACLVDVVEEELGQAGLEDRWNSGVSIEAPAQLALYQVREHPEGNDQEGGDR